MFKTVPEWDFQMYVHLTVLRAAKLFHQVLKRNFIRFHSKWNLIEFCADCHKPMSFDGSMVARVTCVAVTMEQVMGSSLRMEISPKELQADNLPITTSFVCLSWKTRMPLHSQIFFFIFQHSRESFTMNIVTFCQDLTFSLHNRNFSVILSDIMP